MISRDVAFRLPAFESINASPQSRALSRVFDTFSPSLPVSDLDHFAGRRRQLELLIGAIEEHRNHVVLYGLPGRGKTSIALAILSLAAKAKYRTFYVSCSHQSTLASIFSPILAELSRRYDRLYDPQHGKSEPDSTFLELMQGAEFTPQVVGQNLARLTGLKLIIAIDDIDYIESAALLQDLSELMKILSDNLAPVYLMLVGVAGELEHLIGKEWPRSRALFSMKIGLMADAEITDLLGVLCAAAEVQMTRAVADRIVAVVRGRPFLARMVGLQSAKMAVLRESDLIEDADLESALAHLSDYLRAAGFGQVQSIVDLRPEFAALLRAILDTEPDAAETFSIKQVEPKLAHYGLSAHTHLIDQMISTLVAHRILEEIDYHSGRRYRFVDPRVELFAAIVCNPHQGDWRATPAASVGARGTW